MLARCVCRMGMAAVAACGGMVTAAAAADAPSAKQVFQYAPRHKGVEIETPDAVDFDKCQIKSERQGKASAWVVYGPAGQVLRRFADTNGDNMVDQWRYYNHGLEVYRDIDTNANNKMDQHRWFNTAGSRWAVDTDEDGRIDRWKVISPEEVSREVVQALVRRDERALQTLLLTAEDVRALELDDELAAKILKALDDPAAKLREIAASSKILTPETRWMRFDSSSPGVVPAESGKADADVYVYENAMAIVDLKDEEGQSKAGLLQLGELVRVGDAWKLTQFPQPIEGNSVQVTLGGGAIMQPLLENLTGPDVVPGVPGGLSPEMQKLLEQLQKLDTDAPSPGDGAQPLVRYSKARADILEKLIEASKTDEDRAQWRRQLIDCIMMAVNTGGYPEGLDRLKTIEADLRKSDPKSDMLPYVTYRRLMAQFTRDMQKVDADPKRRQEIQTWWLKELEALAEEWPKAPDTAEVLLQLAIAQEFAGNLEQAKKWYGKLADGYADAPAGEKATGALRRLNLDGTALMLQGAGLKGGEIKAEQLRGKVVLVIFWATWCKPCLEDLPQIRDLYQKHRDEGFEILGVNLDTDPAVVQPFLTEHKMTWPQIREEGGVDSPPARQFGIISVPTMFLVDADGKVVSRSISVADLKTQLPALLKK